MRHCGATKGRRCVASSLSSGLCLFPGWPESIARSQGFENRTFFPGEVTGGLWGCKPKLGTSKVLVLVLFFVFYRVGVFL